MTFRPAVSVCLAVSFAWSLFTVAVAADPSLDSARRCGAIDDNFSRLACFDQLFRTVPGKVIAPAPAPPVAPVAATASVAVDKFGEETLKSNAKRAAAASSTPSEITGQVTGLREIGERRYRLTLDNGQVWQQEETQPKTMPEVNVGDTVRIQKRSLGSYLMARVKNGKDSNWIRVTRQK